MNLKISQKTTQDHQQVQLRGDLDGYCESKFRKLLLTPGVRGTGPMLVDCGGITTIDSCGMELLVRLAKHIESQPRQLALYGLRGEPRRNFARALMHEFVDLFEDQAAAVAWLGVNVDTLQ